MRYASFLRRLADAAGNFVDDHVVVRRVSTQQAAETNDGIVFLSFGKRAGCRGDFEGARDADNFDCFLSGAGTQQPVVCALEKSLCDESIET